MKLSEQIRFPPRPTYEKDCMNRTKIPTSGIREEENKPRQWRKHPGVV